MKKHALLFTLVLGTSGLFFCPTFVSAMSPSEEQFVNDLTYGRTVISPAEPTSSDEIILTVSRWMPSSGYGLEITAVCIEGHDIWVDFVIHSPAPGTTVCHLVWQTDGTTSLGYLAPGTYTLYVRREGGPYTEALTFTVLQIVPSQTIDGRLTGWNGSAPTGDCICQRWPALFAGRPCPFCGGDLSHSSDTAESGGGGSLFDSLRQRIAALRQ